MMEEDGSLRQLDVDLTRKFAEAERRRESRSHFRNVILPIVLMWALEIVGIVWALKRFG
jgi:hypothetical protein